MNQLEKINLTLAGGDLKKEQKNTSKFLSVKKDISWGKVLLKTNVLAKQQTEKLEK